MGEGILGWLGGDRSLLRCRRDQPEERDCQDRPVWFFIVVSKMNCSCSFDGLPVYTGPTVHVVHIWLLQGKLAPCMDRGRLLGRQLVSSFQAQNHLSGFALVQVHLRLAVAVACSSEGHCEVVKNRACQCAVTLQLERRYPFGGAVDLRTLNMVANLRPFDGR